MKTKFIFLGISEYDEFLDLQKKLTESKVYKKDKNNYLIITEHYPVYTLGKRIKKEDLPKKNLAKVINLDRGGGITFHGLGQMVVYPIINLKDYNLTLKKYVWLLEEIIIQTLKNINIKSYRKDKLVGVFTDKGKIGFVGLKISKFTTNYGFSINYDVDKMFFENINPCGLKGEKVANITDFVNVSKVKFINLLYKELKKNF